MPGVENPERSMSTASTISYNRRTRAQKRGETLALRLSGRGLEEDSSRYSASSSDGTSSRSRDSASQSSPSGEAGWRRRNRQVTGGRSEFYEMVKSSSQTPVSNEDCEALYALVAELAGTSPTKQRRSSDGFVVVPQDPDQTLVPMPR